MLKTRVFSALIAIPMLLGIMYAGGFILKSFFIILGLLALHEFYRMMSGISISPVTIPGYLLVLVLLLSPIYSDYLPAGFFLIIICAVVYSVLCYPKITISDISLSVFMAAYIGFLLSYAVRITDFEQSFWILLLSFLLTWSSDVGGYMAGSFWGKRKLAPLLSPNKTWAGVIGGIILTVMVSYVFSNIIEITDSNGAYALLLGIIASTMAQIGDLFISSAKRYFGVKDTGNILPGHGGVLDRFDSYMMVVPVVYYYFLLMV